MSRIARIKQSLTADGILALCQLWLPGGKQKGKWYMVCSPFRQEKTPSFGVCLTDGGFHDFGDPTSRGDLIDLCQRLHGVTMADALEAFEQMLGLDE